MASSVFANDEQDCFQGRQPQLRIRGCSDIIRRSPDDATAYHNRAVAYELAGEINNAIIDYSKVIALAPTNASAYANRGRAYASRGDYAHAADDDAKAQELIAKATTQPPFPAPLAPTAATQPNPIAAIAAPAAEPLSSSAAMSPSEPASRFPEGVRDKQLEDCLRVWDKETHMSTIEWRAACQRSLHRLDDVTAEFGQKRAPAESRQ